MICIDERGTVDLLKSLIRIDSVNPDLMPGGPGEAEIAVFIEEFMVEVGLEVYVQQAVPGRPNVIGILRGNDPVNGKSLMLNGHTDTVGIGKMEIPPFDPVELDGRIYGRGSADMKSGVTAMLSAAKSIAKSGVSLRGDLIVAAVVDEEYASIGTEALVKGFTAVAAIVIEPTDLNITVAHKGFAWIDIDTSGHAAHGSDPAEGVDAIMMMTDVLQKLRSFDQNVLRTRSHPILSPPSLHASVIDGGKELSTYPDFCRLQVERRTIPGESQESVAAEIDSILLDCQSANAEFKATSNIFFYREPLEIDRDDEVVRTLHHQVGNVTGEMPEYNGSAGWMDSGILCKAGIPTVIFGPGGDGFHAAVEYADRKSLLACTKVLAETIETFCG
ncbi:MAG: ArgE/DapE family deacylase [Gemmatimonadota bacterium]|nr:ArgE/DapE family deacylase [Gemmatimonadota bacterium]